MLMPGMHIWTGLARVMLALCFSLVALGQNTSEHVFLHGMIDHYRVGQKMAELCSRNAMRPELKSQCSAIKGAEDAQLKQMLAWSEQWNRTQISEHNDIMEESAIKKIRKLKGDKFDREFLKQMNGYFSEGLQRLQDCQRRASHAELVQFCSELEQQEKTRQRTLDSLQQQWFGAPKP